MMKHVQFSFGFILFAVLLLACSAAKEQNQASPDLHRKWMLVEYKDFTKEELINLGAFIDLRTQSLAKKTYTAKMGCNSLRFTGVFEKNGKAEFSKIISTRMYCEGRMKLEESFGKEFPEMTSYKINGHFLTFSDGKGNEMKFVADDWD